MAEKYAKLNRRTQDALRAKIQADKLILHIQAFALQKAVKLPDGRMAIPKMTATRLRASLALLDKRLPDIKATELILDEETRKAVLSAAPLSEDEWVEKYGKKAEPALVVKLDAQK